MMILLLLPLSPLPYCCCRHCRLCRHRHCRRCRLALPVPSSSFDCCFRGAGGASTMIMSSLLFTLPCPPPLYPPPSLPSTLAVVIIFFVVVPLLLSSTPSCHRHNCNFCVLGVGLERPIACRGARGVSSRSPLCHHPHPSSASLLAPPLPTRRIFRGHTCYLIKFFVGRAKQE